MKKKEKYEAPTISVTVVEMENGIAVGSAKVTPVEGGGIQYEYDQGDDVVKEFEW